jgi:hypothetical protein
MILPRTRVVCVRHGGLIFDTSKTPECQNFLELRLETMRDGIDT